MRRTYIEALTMGLLICVAVVGLEYWTGNANGAVRVGALLIIGALLCAIQYGIVRFKNRR